MPKVRKDYFFINSTLLFFALPSALLLSAIGFSSPNPAELNREASIPALVIASTTDLARASESFKFDSLLPSLSVCPSKLIF